MTATLETLELTPDQLESSREAVRKMAYCKWLDAGRPDGLEVEFWLQAEREWIEHNYVPHRTLDGTRPEPTRSAPRIAAPATLDDAESLTGSLAMAVATASSTGSLS